MSTTRAARIPIVSACASVFAVCLTSLGAAQAPPTTTATTRARTQVPTRIQVPTVAMPNLVGQAYQAALRDPAVIKNKLALTARETPSTRTAGTIVGQEPAAGSPIRLGSPATVFVAVAPPAQGRASRPPDRENIRPEITPIPMVRVPKVAGLSEGEAADELSNRRFQIVRQSVVVADQKAGIVVAQTPEAGTLVRPRSAVSITVARQPDPVLPTMPNLVGRQFGDASQDKLVRSLELRLVPRDIVARVTPGVIVRQEPAPAAPVRPGMPVVVYVAMRAPTPPDDVAGPVGPAGPKLDPAPATPPLPTEPVRVRMPDLIGRSFTQAEQHPQVLDARLRLDQQFDTTAPGLPGTIVRQSVPAGSGVEVGRNVAVLVATGVAVPLVLEQASGVAERQIAAVGLRPAVSSATSDQEPGTVITQVPAAGVMVSRGASVAITVAVAERVIVPDVVGRTRAEADQALTRLKLRVVAEDDALSSDEPGRVATQQPASGADVVAAATVRVGVATGVTVPRVTGLSAEDAQRAVSQRGLSFEDTDVVSDQVPAGQVLSQQPAAGQTVARGSRVRVAIALAPSVVVPSVVGLARERAIALAAAASLVVSVQSTSQTGTAGVVLRQEPAANARVARGTTLSVFIPLPGVVTVVVPDLVGRSRQDAQSALVGLRLVARTSENDSDRPVGTVISQSPAAGTQVVPPSEVALVLARQAVTLQTPRPPVTGGTPSTAVPVEPLLPVWVGPLLVVLTLVGLSTLGLVRSGRGNSSARQSAQATTPTVDVEPEAGEHALRLEVSGRSLVDLEVRVRVMRDAGEQSVQVAGDALVAEERRIYE